MIRPSDSNPKLLGNVRKITREKKQRLLAVINAYWRPLLDAAKALLGDGEKKGATKGLLRHVAKTVQQLYEQATRQAARAVRRGGRLVMLTPSRAVLEFCLSQQGAYWEETHNLRVNCGGAVRYVTVRNGM